LPPRTGLRRLARELLDFAARPPDRRPEQGEMMKRTVAVLGLLACAVGSSASAQTSVTLSGLVDLGIESGKDAGVAKRTTQMNPGGMTTSYFKLAGSEDLGGGMSASFLLSSFFRPNTGAYGRFGGDTLFSRDASISLNGGFGSLTLGRQLDPAFVPIVAFNPFGDSFSYSPLVFHTYLGASTYNAPLALSDSGYSNAASYTTPDFGGAKASFVYQFGGIAGSTGKANYGANILYFGGPLALTAFYESNELSNPVPSLLSSLGFLGYAKAQVYGIGASYDLKLVKLYANYENSKYTGLAGAGSDKDKIYNLGLSVPAGPGAFLLDYAQTKIANAFATFGGASWKTASVGYDWTLSKRTDLYVADKNDKFTGLSSGNQLGFGIRHRF
jgi:predicted porin